MKSREKD